jgi:hypothetical protein
MALVTMDEKGQIVDTSKHRWMFVCDRCGNTVPHSNSMEIYRLAYREDGGENDHRSFCSSLCVTQIIRQESNIIPMEVK